MTILPSTLLATHRLPSRGRAPAKSGRADGFSLIEVLAAFVVLALVGTALFRLFSGALANVSLADEYSRATLFAESRIAAMGVESTLREGTDQGTSDDNRYTWSSRVEAYKPPPEARPQLDLAPDTSPLRLWRLVVEVRWPGNMGNERTIALTTVKAAVRELGQ
jgi:general secretion pathway protein I